MSDKDTPSLHEELEVRVIAFLTGELPEADVEELEKILAVDEELSTFRDRMARLMGNVHSAREEIAPPPAAQEMKLSEERRRAIFENENAVKSTTKDDEKKWWHLGLLEIAAMLILGAFLAAVMIPSVGSVRKMTFAASEFKIADMAELEPESQALETSIPYEVLEGTPQPIVLPSRSLSRFRQNAPEPQAPASPPPAVAMKQLYARSMPDEVDELEALGDIPAVGRLYRSEKTDVEELSVALDDNEVTRWGVSVGSGRGSSLSWEEKSLLRETEVTRDQSAPTDTYASYADLGEEGGTRSSDEAIVSGGVVPVQDFGIAGEGLGLESGNTPTNVSSVRREMADADRDYAGSIASRGKVDAGARIEMLQQQGQSLVETDSSAMAMDFFAAPVAAASSDYKIVADEPSGGPVDRFAAPAVASVAKPKGSASVNEFYDAGGVVVNTTSNLFDFDGEQLIAASEEVYRSSKSQSSISSDDPFAAPELGSSSRSEEFVDAFAAPKLDVNGGYMVASGTVAAAQGETFGWDNDERRKESAKKMKNGEGIGYSYNFEGGDMEYEDLAKNTYFGSKLEETDQPRSKTSAAMLAGVERNWERPSTFDFTSNVDGDLPAPTTVDKLNSIVIPNVNFSGTPLSDVVTTLEALSVEYDPEGKGVDLSYIQNEDGADPHVNLALRNLSVDRILRFVTQQTNFAYDVGIDTVTISPPLELSNAEKVAIARNENVRQAPKPEKQTEQAPVSTFSLNVSDVSFELAQAALASQRIPSAELIRTEEFVNGFSYGDPTPRENEPVTLNWEIAQHPYQHNRQIVRFSLQTQAAGRNASQPLNLNLLVDNSGSMQRPDRRAILEKSLEALQSKLTNQDQLNVVLFARQPKLIANASNVVDQKAAIEQTLNYQPEGGTNLESGLNVAYNVAQQNYDASASNRVILITDGAANLGEVDAGNLAKTVVENRKQGIALDAYGIGWEDYNDALLEEITRNGDGRYAFLNDVDTAAEDFAEKLAGTLRVSAADVKVQIIWNPERVKTYRQIGYDLHQLKEQDFRDNTVDAAEIGEAESGTALYVVQLDDDSEISGGLGKLQVRYRVPATGEYLERAWPLDMPRKVPALEEAAPSLRLAASSGLFAERLANNPYATNYSFDDLEDLTEGLPEAFPAQSRVVELQNMIQSANSLFTGIE